MKSFIIKLGPAPKHRVPFHKKTRGHGDKRSKLIEKANRKEI